MSVYTSVDLARLEQFLMRYDLGKAVDFKPIAAGITNSNYALETDHGRFVMTLYEHHSDDELDYMLRLQRHLAKRGLRCSQPVKDRRGEFYSSLSNRPTAIIRRLPGEVQSRPDLEQCALIGAELAKFHLAGRDFEPVRVNPRGLDWIVAVRDMLQDYLDYDDQKAIESSLLASQKFDIETLPRGAIHAVSIGRYPGKGGARSLSTGAQSGNRRNQRAAVNVTSGCTAFLVITPLRQDFSIGRGADFYQMSGSVTRHAPFSQRRVKSTGMPEWVGERRAGLGLNQGWKPHPWL